MCSHDFFRRFYCRHLSFYKAYTLFTKQNKVIYQKLKIVSNLHLSKTKILINLKNVLFLNLKLFKIIIDYFFLQKNTIIII